MAVEITPLWECLDQGCAEETSYPADMLRWFQGGLICEGCFDYIDQETAGPEDDPVRWYDLPEFRPLFYLRRPKKSLAGLAKYTDIKLPRYRSKERSRLVEIRCPSCGDLAWHRRTGPFTWGEPPTKIKAHICAKCITIWYAERPDDDVPPAVWKAFLLLEIELPGKVAATLNYNGVKTVGQLCENTSKELLRMRMLGPYGVGQIEMIVEAMSLGLADREAKYRAEQE